MGQFKKFLQDMYYLLVGGVYIANVLYPIVYFIVYVYFYQQK